MPIDYSHQHLSTSVMEEGSPHTPISTGGSSIDATDTQVVFMDGDTPVGSADLTWDGAAAQVNGRVAVTHDPTPDPLGVAVQIEYVGEPTDYVPLLQIGNDADVAYAIDSSGDSDHYFFDSGVSLIYHVKYDGQPGGVEWQLFKIGEDGFLFHASGGARLFEVYPSDGSILMFNLPTIDPHHAGQLWNSTGTLKISAG